MWWGFSTASPVRNLFVFDIVRRVSSFSKAVELANRLTPRGLRGLRGLADPAHLVPDLLRGLVRVLVVRDHDLRDLAEVDHVLLPHVVSDVDQTRELPLHLLVGYALHLNN